MLRMIALALAVCLLSSGCGHYGPPVRAEAPAAEQTPTTPDEAEEDPEESEQP